MLNNQLAINSKLMNGFSLIELLIALLLSSILLAMVIGLYVTGVTSGSKSLKYSRLRTDIQSLVTMIEKDVRRAGFGGSDYLVGISANKSIDINSAKNCIVYYYNHNQSSSLEHSNKMAISLKNNAIKFKTGVGKVAEDVCSATSGWKGLSDDKFISISQFILTEMVTSSATATIRSLDITLSGELVSDSQYSQSVSSRVQIRNPEFN
ncbi:prepilin-type N-terminal cleavage/methylation domain-containing protein [Psychromonas sp. KJ10-10]|uniref:prepilin-type N-terminal cleavage/methylation domain-containing protein n=1 Tax=Psychromonas sp. KJ10-10 TaxID=3391823 RepID=UPI0039B56C28